MLTGTALDLTPFGAVLQSLGMLYWLFVLIVLSLIFFKIKDLAMKSVSLILFSAVFILPAALALIREIDQRQQAKNHMVKVKAHFEMRCKTAGEKIKRTVENVDGLLLMKLRPKGDSSHWADQFYMNDPYGRDLYEEGYVESFLTKRGSLSSETDGYHYVDFFDVKEAHFFQFTAIDRDAHSFSMRKKKIEKSSARYGVTFDDISTRQDREFWIAGGSLRIVDLLTQEVIAERIGYMLDLGQGSKAGFRSPWLFAAANACPEFIIPKPSGSRASDQVGQTRRFVEKVLKPKTVKN
jgi:hypothetical protein